MIHAEPARATSARRSAKIALLAVLAALVLAVWARSVIASPSTGGFDERIFYLTQEFYGPGAYTAPQVTTNLNDGMANTVAFFSPVDSGMAQFVAGQSVGLVVNLPGAVAPSGASPGYIDAQRAGMSSIAGTLGPQKVLWNLMAEWDQSGGSWVPQGRPSYTGLTPADAYTKFINYYLTQTFPLGTYLAQPSVQRPFIYAAVTDYSPNAAYAYDLGVDTCLLERSIDELGDLSTGVAFLRGAARQYDRQWGIDVSTWRTSNGMATTYNSQNVLLGGWSASYLKRHYYATYMSSAHVLKTEATVYSHPNGKLNPFGQMAEDFADFALARHPDVGLPAVPMALLVDHYSGFDPKHWLYSQGNMVWYGDIPYSDGDYMINNFLILAYPNHWLHGLTPGAPFADSTGKPDPVQFQNYLAAGGDPRPYEPMPNTRWGDNLDIITSRASQSALRKYKIIALLGSVAISPQLQESLQRWVAAGGVLVMNVNQLANFDESFLGVGVQNTVKNGRLSQWTSDGTQYAEPSFTYTVVAPSTASVLATGPNSDPLITSNPVGRGQVILSTPKYLQTNARDQILNIGTRLFDWLQSQYALAQVSGPPVEYIVNQASYGIVVTVLNHAGSDWNGSITTNTVSPISAVTEFTADEAAPYTVSGFTVQVSAHVPAYDVRVYGIALSNPANARPPGLPVAKKRRN